MEADTSLSSIEKRIDELEREVADLKEHLGRRPRNAWLSTLGRFRDDADYDEAMRLGRAYRKRDR